MDTPTPFTDMSEAEYQLLGANIALAKELKVNPDRAVFVYGAVAAALVDYFIHVKQYTREAALALVRENFERGLAEATASLNAAPPRKPH